MLHTRLAMICFLLPPTTRCTIYRFHYADVIATNMHFDSQQYLKLCAACQFARFVAASARAKLELFQNHMKEDPPSMTQ
jgi:hypothetical protein